MARRASYPGIAVGEQIAEETLFMKDPVRTRRHAAWALVIYVGFGWVKPVAAETGSLLLQTVSPGQSIQAAINKATEGGWIFVQPGTYQETSDPTNGLNISRGVHLVGLSTSTAKVVIKNSGGQRNGIAAVPAAHANCMSCHSDLAPPFPLLPGVNKTVPAQPVINNLSISGITLQNFANNGLFTSNVNGFAFIDVHVVGSKSYGIFPTLSQNGLISFSSVSGTDDTGIWIETSQNVTATNNLVEDNVVGVEVSNSQDILLADNESRGNSIGVAVIFLPGLFASRPDTKRITVRGNHVHDNNKANTASGSILATIPASLGIVYFGSDDSLITANVVENNNLSGIAIADYCLAVAGGPFDCSTDPAITPGFVADNGASNNRVTLNRLSNNGKNPGVSNPFAFAAGDISLLTAADNGNCFTDNTFASFFSTLGILPKCH